MILTGYKSFYSAMLGLCTVLTLKAQPSMNIAVIAPLPDTLNESSSLERTGPNCFWSHNDSGGQPELYNFDSTGTLLRILQVTNATNVDWEELTTDTAGNLYIGDFGNNNCDRQNLVIYRIPNPDSVVGNSVAAEAIYFSYQNQYAFPPHPSLRNFDMEAMIAMNDSLYLFTKNQTSPSDGWCKVYRLPLDSGTFVAQLVDSFLIGSGSTDGYSITAARITTDYDTLLLISHERIWIFSAFTGAHFFNGTSAEFQFNTATSNKEGIDFGSGSHIYISDEFTVAGTQNLYYIDLLNPTMSAPPVGGVSPWNIAVYPNPVSDQVTIQSAAAASYNLTDATGRMCLSGTVASDTQVNIDLSFLENGIYFLVLITQDDHAQTFKLTKANSLSN